MTTGGEIFGRRPRYFRSLLPQRVAVEENFGPVDAIDLYPVEIEAIAKASPTRRKEFSLGRRCARAALSQFGIPPCPIPANADRTPGWPASVVGSITHSGDYCGAAVAFETDFLGLGIDAEQVARVEPRLWQTFGSADELAYVLALPEECRQAAAAIMFSAKESFFKAQYGITGKWIGFEAATVEILPERLRFRVHPLDPPRTLGPYALFEGSYLLADGFCFTALLIEARR
jgi:4'-phosphopantetheinyl transferase EntD